MGIKIINSFDLNSPLPLDARAIANNISEMNELITKNFVVAGQMCYNKADNKLYILKTNESNVLTWYEIADSVDIDNVNKVLPTDIAVKNNKLGLEHNNTWLTNQNAINLGANLEYDATTKTLNAKGGGGESSIKVYDWELESDKATQKLYLKNITINDLDNIMGEIALINIYIVQNGQKQYYAHCFMIYSYMPESFAFELGFYAGDTLNNGSPDNIYHVYIKVESDNRLSYNQVKVNIGSGSSEIPTLSTIASSMSDLTTTVYSDDDIALIKKQKDNFIKVPFGTTDNNTSELCYVSYGNKYSLIDVAGNMLSVVNAFSESPTFLYFNLDETNKKLVGESYSALSATDTSLYVESSVNKIFLTDQLTLSSPTQVLNKAYYFDKINGKSIIHEENTINNYTIPTITFED